MGFDVLSYVLGRNSVKGESGGGTGSETERITVLEKNNHSFAFNEGFGAFASSNASLLFNLEKDKEYIVEWDGVEYNRTAFEFTAADGASCIALGNPICAGGESNGDSFAIVTDKTNFYTHFLSLEQAETHSVAIYKEKSGFVEGVHFVTFMNEDGTKELYKRAVVNEDDCADPVIRGYIDEPTKESTAQYNYTHVGWSGSPNGALDENILKSVTEDKTVYANFAAVLRYYTITYYDSDGTTVLKTESLAYGTYPSYAPTKDNMDFLGWEPDEPVSGDMSYTAKWEDKVTFANGTWERIAEICAAGNASNYFAVGDKRPITLTYTDGTSETINFTIVDMNVDTLSDGSTVPLTIMADNLVKKSTKLIPAFNESSGIIYKCATFSAFLTELENAFPADLMSVVKPAMKASSMGAVCSKIFIPTYKNLTNENGTMSGTTYTSYPNLQYSYFAKGNSIKRNKLNNSASGDYWTATVYEARTTSSPFSWLYKVVKTDGSTTASIGSNEEYGVCPCFCI